MSNNKNVPMEFPIGIRSPDIVLAVRDYASYLELNVPDNALLIDEVPVPGQPLKRIIVHDTKTLEHKHLHIVGAEVAWVELTYDRAYCKVGLRGADSTWCLRIVKSVIDRKFHNVCGYESSRLPEPPHWTECQSVIPSQWLAVWQVDPSDDGIVGFEEGCCAFVPRDGRVCLAYGSWHSESMRCAPISNDELGVLREWVQTGSLLFPGVSAMASRFRPRLDANNKENLVKGFMDSIRLLAY